MISDTVWFTVKEQRWKIGFFGRFSWTGKEQLWDSDNCTISITRTIKDKCLIVVRSNQTKYSDYMQKNVMIRYMLGFEISTVPLEPRTETYTARNNIPKKRKGPKKRWVLQLDDKHWIWEWAPKGKDIKNSTIYRLYREIVTELEHHSILPNNILKAQIEGQSEELIPIIYQPSIDAIKNFVREVHCAKEPQNPDGSYTMEVSLLFNNEQLRQHGILNTLYECIRRLIYGRTMDLESFKIHIAKNPQDSRFIFEGIYSGNKEINADFIHGDKVPQPPPKRPIKYYFMNQNHPVVFINTSNHAMAEHDTNNRLWKWEYVPWLSDAPVKLGSMSRKELEKSLKKPYPPPNHRRNAESLKVPLH
ncbi:MAG: hypothetical protein LBI79_07170 [Nitrososphaerota archaeon]|nr:hypothetical protein [Nitrososphaerota archaeon]